MLKHVIAAAMLLMAQAPPSRSLPSSEAKGSGQAVADDARQVVRHALAAVEGDSVAVVRGRWTPRARNDAGDRAARLGLATLARLTYDHDGAARAYRALDRTRPDPIATYARLGLAEQLYMQGRAIDAEAEFGRARDAARAAGLRGAEARALGFLAMLRANSVGLPAGIAALDSADRLAPAAASDVRADLLRFRSVMQAVVGEADSASYTAARCVREARRAVVLRAEAQCLRAEALNRKLQSDDDSALALLDEVVRLQRAARDRGALSETLVRQADALRATGRYGLTRRVLREALAEAVASHNDLARAAVHTGLGSVALRVRDHSEAARQLRSARELYERSGDSLSRAAVLAFQSILDAAVGDLDAARRHAAEVVAAYRRVGDPVEEFNSLRQLAAVEIRARNWPAATRVLDEAVALARRTGDGALAANLDFDRGRLALHRGNVATAERLLRRYLASRDTSERLTIHTTRTYLADTRARQGDLTGAAQELARAGDVLDAWRASLSDESLRLHAFQVNSHDMYRRDPSVARVLAALATGGHADAAFALAEHTRARSLMDRLVQADAMRAGASAADADAPDDPMRPVLAVAGDARYDGAADALAAALPDDRTALLEYVAGRDGVPSTLFVVTRAGVLAHRIAPADSLQRVVERFGTMLEAGDDPRVPARALGVALLDPALASLPASVTRIVVVPDGPLHRVPFDALRLADGRYVIERFAVSYVPSAGVAVALWQRPRTRDDRPLRLLAIGDPTFTGMPAEARGAAPAYRSAFDAAGGLPRLTASGAEARAVARFAPDADVRLRDRASAAWLREAPLDGYRVIHLATHALVDDRAIGRSAIALTPGDGESGFLGAGDLAALRLDADLVVLSACRTAGGVVLDGEGVQGLTAPLLRAGARAVVATGWRIDDERTVALVLDFYRSLAAGRAVGDALREAKLLAMRRGAPPSEWAAFTVVGDPFVTVALVEPRVVLSAVWIAAIVAAAIGVLAAGVVIVRRRRGA